MIVNDSGEALETFWVTHPAWPGAMFRVCSLLRSEFDADLHRRKDRIPPLIVARIGQRGLKKKIRGLMVEAVVTTFLQDWRGVEIHGKQVPFANAREALLSSDLLLEVVFAAACRLDSDEVPGEIALGLA